MPSSRSLPARASSWSLVAASSVLLVGSTAHAQATSLHGTAQATVAGDDNIRSSSTPLADVSLTISPGLLLLHRLERGALTVSYQRSFVFFFVHSQISSSADTGLVDFGYSLSPVDEIGFAIGINRAATNLISLAAPSASAAGAQPAQPVQLLTPSFSQRYGHSFSRRWSLGQTSSFTYSTPLGENTSYSKLATATAGVGPQVALEDHSFGLQGRFSYNYLSAIPGQEGSQSFHQLVPATTANWTWYFAERWQQQVSGGVAVPLTTAGDLTVAPLGTLTTLYTQEQFGASLVLNQGVSPSLRTQQIFLSDNATLAAYLPILAEEKLFVEGAGSLAYNRIFAQNNSTGGAHATSWSLDFGLTWAPPSLPLSFTARYQHFQQLLSNNPLLQEYSRNVVSLGVGMVLPSIDPQMRPRGPFQPPGMQTPGARLGTEDDEEDQRQRR